MDQNAGSAYVEYDFGLPMDPLPNLPQTACNDPHELVRRLDSARMQLDHFFDTGIVQNFCAGACSYPQQGGCP